MSWFRRSAHLLICAVLLVPWPARAEGVASRRKIAILELRNQAGLTPDEAAFFTDVARGGALTGAGPGHLVMTRESILALLPPGTDLASCVGECEVETGRNVGADLVVSGDIVRVGGELKVVLKLHETASAALVGSTRASAPDLKQLEPAVEQAAIRLFEGRVTPPVGPASGAASAHGSAGAAAGARESATRLLEGRALLDEALDDVDPRAAGGLKADIERRAGKLTGALSRFRAVAALDGPEDRVAGECETSRALLSFALFLEHLASSATPGVKDPARFAEAARVRVVRFTKGGADALARAIEAARHTEDAAIGRWAGLAAAQLAAMRRTRALVVPACPSRNEAGPR
jgi:hypothetical protein